MKTIAALLVIISTVAPRSVWADDPAAARQSGGDCDRPACPHRQVSEWAFPESRLTRGPTSVASCRRGEGKRLRAAPVYHTHAEVGWPGARQGSGPGGWRVVVARALRRLSRFGGRECRSGRRSTGGLIHCPIHEGERRGAFRIPAAIGQRSDSVRAQDGNSDGEDRRRRPADACSEASRRSDRDSEWRQVNTKHMNRSRGAWLLSMTINLVVLLCPAIGQGLPVGVEAWKIERTVIGGIVGVNQFLSVTSAG